MRGVSLKRERNASVAVFVFVFRTQAQDCGGVLAMLLRRHKGMEENRPGANGRSQRPAAVGRAGPFRPEEHTFFPSHSARRASFHYGKSDTVPAD